ncbi:hypothetical protein AK88_01187 [Plasmodium fragile]|uniref:Plasmodium RESA N-terminal domain-containing protein n=1 Tax=Plasmodium fragile TaxID=5857 RepID=A0A0D9QTQ5_PLAFR|nr:uncharacterized protein AK88_01187 [Plasmodium fragile]KJP89101.1 hypothetical protein AK88_01187 [Plasmodium fragile]
MYVTKKLPMLGFTSVLFIVWICIFLIHHNCKQCNILEELGIRCYQPRSLSEATNNKDDSNDNNDGAPTTVNESESQNETNSASHTNDCNNVSNIDIFHTQKYEDFLSKMKDINLGDQQVLTAQEINKLLDSLGCFLNKKKARLIFYHYNKFMKKLYRNSMDRLWTAFISAALQKGIPQPVQLYYWKKCDDDMMAYFVDIDGTFLDKFRSYLPKGNILSSMKFFSWLTNYKNLWMKELEEHEKKWSNSLKENLDNCVKW